MKANFFANAKRAFVGSDDYDERDLTDEEEYDEDSEEEYEEKKRISAKDFFSFLSGRPANEYDEEEEEDDEPEDDIRRRFSYDRPRERATAREAASKERTATRDYSSSRQTAASGSSHIRYNPASADTEIVVVSLTNFDDTEKIVREVKGDKIIIFDVSEIKSTEDARRVVDYISGAAAGMECPFSKLFNGIFCIAPKGVKLTTKRSKYM